MADKKKRALTVSDLKPHVDAVVARAPLTPVMIGICTCGSRSVSFANLKVVECPRCKGEIEVFPITVEMAVS